MTNVENEKLTKLMYEAIKLGKQAKEELNAWEKLKKENNIIDAEIKQRQGDQHYGECVGINQVLATLKFKHDDMKILSELI
jgi:GH18 family chitinase